MRKRTISGQAMRSICAAAMALTLAVPTTLYMKTTVTEAALLDDAVIYDFEEGTEALTREGEKSLKLVENADGVKVPVVENGEYVKEESTALPEVKEDEVKGKVLEFKDSVKADRYEKTVSDELDEKYPVKNEAEKKDGALLQLKERVGGRVKLDNPFKGMTFAENDESAGVTISYWVKCPEIQVNSVGEKVPEGTAGSKSRIANSTTVVFNNSGRVVMNKDDQMKHIACMNYDKAVADNDEAALKDYDLGTQKLVRDNDGNTYTLYQNYGKLLRFNPSYPVASFEEQATKKGGWYVPKDAKDGKIEVKDDEGNTYKISSFQTRGSTTEDQNQYELFRYSYKKEDDKENGFSSKSKIREEAISGSLQISTDNDFGFREDNYREEKYQAEDGSVIGKAVDGAVISNPNSDKYNTIQNIRGYNQFYFDGDEMATEQSEPDIWHYVTVVIQNDWVLTYVDGVAADPELDYQYMKEEPGLSGSQHDFGTQNVGKLFNKGTGLRAPFILQNNVDAWSEDGSANETPANELAISMLDWIADEKTELYLGGTGYASEMLTQGYGTIEGVCLDDVSFIKKALTEDEAIELYDEAKEAAGMDSTELGDIDGNGKVDLTDAQLVLKAALKINTLTDAQFKAADTNGDGKVDLTDAQKVLKVALKIESFK